MTNCDKCTSVHIAQEKGLQSKPCECDCHNRGEILCAVPFHIPKLITSETRQAPEKKRPEDKPICIDCGSLNHIACSTWEDVKEQEICPYCCILPSGYHITESHMRCNKQDDEIKKIPLKLIEQGYTDVKLIPCKEVHHPPNCNTIHKYYTKPLKSVK